MARSLPFHLRITRLKSGLVGLLEKIVVSLENMDLESMSFLWILDSTKSRWEEFAADVRGKKIIKSIARFIYALIFPIISIIACIMIVVGHFLIIGFSLLGPSVALGARYRDKVANEERENFEKCFFQSSSESYQEHSITKIQSRLAASPSDTSKSPLFRLPLEIRREILIHAFGQHTMHMSLEFQRPFCMTEEPFNHAKIHQISVTEDFRSRRWMWFGCICHRFPPECSGPRGAFRNRDTDTLPEEPEHDRCLQGVGSCDRWPDQAPASCQIGALGWLLTCRQAYIEGFHVLYRTNTFHIASKDLAINVQQILSGAVLSNMTSLELVWNLDETPLNNAFTNGNKELGSYQSTVFPAMVSLRFSFGEFSTTAALEGIGDEDAPTSRISDFLITKLLPDMDDFIHRIVPASTDVTVSCPTWEWLKASFDAINEVQGEDVSKLQQADMGGAKFWRKTSLADTTTSPELLPDGNSLEEGMGPRLKREGFWIHYRFPRMADGNIQLGEDGLELRDYSLNTL